MSKSVSACLSCIVVFLLNLFVKTSLKMFAHLNLVVIESCGVVVCHKNLLETIKFSIEKKAIV